MTPQEADSGDIARPDEVNRLWQHGMHEERLFHDRLNYFTAMQIGLLGVFAIMYNKEPALGLFLLLTVVALAFTLLWLAIQVRHWRYCVHVNGRIKQLVPEYRATLAEFAAPGRTDGLSISRPLALGVPALFAVTWVAFFTWLLVRSEAGVPAETVVSADRVALVALLGGLIWLVLRLRRVERLLRQLESRLRERVSGR